MHARKRAQEGRYVKPGSQEYWTRGAGKVSRESKGADPWLAFFHDRRSGNQSTYGFWLFNQKGTAIAQNLLKIFLLQTPHIPQHAEMTGYGYNITFWHLSCV
jgi:hypothetical protein